MVADLSLQRGNIRQLRTDIGRKRTCQRRKTMIMIQTLNLQGQGFSSEQLVDS